jgi:hypothetical protein
MDTLVNMAEEVGVEPTRHLLSTSTALKAAASTGTHTLPNCYRLILFVRFWRIYTEFDRTSPEQR